MPSQEKWWEVKKQDRAEAVWALFRTLNDQAAPRITAYRRWRNLYLGRDSAEVEVVLDTADYMPVNELRNMVDTQVGKIARSLPRPMHMTRDGDYTLRVRARRLDQYLEGAFLRAEYKRHAADCVWDGCVHGTGILKALGGAGAEPPSVVRVYPWEVLIDELEAYYGTPRTYIQYRIVDRRVARALFPGVASEIEDADVVDAATLTVNLVDPLPLAQADSVLVAEAWHLPSVKGADDGWHSIVIGGKVLAEDREWARMAPPLMFYRYSRRPTGFWGLGLVERKWREQVKLAELVDRIEEALEVAAVPRVLSHKDAKIAAKQIDNEIGKVWQWEGLHPPVWNTPTAMNPEAYAWAGTSRAWMYEGEGISAMSARAEKPAGLESKPALRTFQDIQSERHLEAGENWERLAIDTAARFVEELRAQAAELGAGGAKQIVIRAPVGRTSWRELTWADVEIPEDGYQVQTYPVAALASSPPARLEQVNELVGLVPMEPEDVLRLLDWPDLEAWQKRRLSHFEIAERQLAQILEEGEYSPPEPLQDLEVAARVAAQTWLVAASEKAPDERLEMVRAYLDECLSWLLDNGLPPPKGTERYAKLAFPDKMAALAAAAAAPDPGGLGAGPMPPEMPPEMMAEGAPPLPPELAAAVRPEA